MKFTRIAAVGLVAASLSIVGFAGCGGSDSSSSAASDTAAATTAAMTKAELVSAANAICTDVRAKVESLNKDADPTDLASLQKFMTDAQGASEQAVADLKALTPPDEIATEYTTYVDAQGTLSAKTSELVTKVSSATTPDEAVKVITEASTELDAVQKDAEAKATAAGLDECAKSSSDSTDTTDSGN